MNIRESLEAAVAEADQQRRRDRHGARYMDVAEVAAQRAEAAMERAVRAMEANNDIEVRLDVLAEHAERRVASAADQVQQIRREAQELQDFFARLEVAARDAQGALETRRMDLEAYAKALDARQARLDASMEQAQQLANQALQMRAYLDALGGADGHAGS
ncbi:MAG: hypothetical protein J7D61_07820 [Marichromatium sp.]|nr:hypothetical protein [Marichromatium sp.]